MCNWHRNFLQGIYDAWFLADLAYGAIHTGNTVVKNRQKRVKKNIPWDCHGMSNFPGGGRQFYGLLHTTTGNLQGIFSIFCHKNQFCPARTWHIPRLPQNIP